MSYTKNTWQRGNKLTSAKLNHMEDGIADAHIEIAKATELVSGNKEKIEQNAIIAEQAASEAITAINENRDRIQEQAETVAAHLEAADSLIAQVSENVNVLASTKVIAEAAKTQSDVNKTDIAKTVSDLAATNQALSDLTLRTTNAEAAILNVRSWDGRITDNKAAAATALSKANQVAAEVDVKIQTAIAPLVSSSTFQSSQEAQSLEFITSLSQTKADLQTQITQNATTLSSLNSSLTSYAKQADLTSLSSTVTAHTSTLSTLTTDTSTIKTDISQLKTDISKAQADIVSANERITANLSSIEKNKADCEAATKEALTSIQSNALRIQEQADAAASHIQASEETLAKVNANISAISDLKVKQDEHTNTLAVQSSSISDIKKDITSHTTTLETHTDTLSDLSSRLDYHNSSLTSLDSRILSLEETTPNLSSDIATLTTSLSSTDSSLLQLKSDLSDVTKKDGTIDSHIQEALIPYQKKTDYETDVTSRISSVNSTIQSTATTLQASIDSHPTHEDLSLAKKDALEAKELFTLYQSDLTKAQEDITSLSTSLASAKSDISTYAVTISEHTEALNHHTAKLGDQADAIDAASHTLTDVQDRLDAHDVTLEDLDDRVTSLSTTLTSATSTIDDNKTKITQALSSIESNALRIQEQADAAASHIQAAEESLSLLDDKVSELATLKTNLASTQGSLASLTSQVDLNTSTLTTQTERIDSLVSTQATQSTSLSDIQTSLASVQSTIPELATLLYVDTHTSEALLPYLTSTSYQEDQTVRESTYDTKYLAPSALEPLNSKVATLTTSLSTLSSSFTDLSGKQTELSASLSSLSDQVASNTTAIQVNQTSLSSHTDQISSIKASLSAQAASISQLDTSSQTLSDDIKSLTSTLSSHTTSPHLLASDISGLVAISGTNATKAEHVITTTKDNHALTARIWNEASGGGLQFINEETNTKAFIGVNNGATSPLDIWAQYYAVDATSKIGTRVNFTRHGVFITEDASSATYSPNDKVLTLKDIDFLETQAARGVAYGRKSLSDIDAILSRLSTLEEQISLLRKLDIDTTPITSTTNQTLTSEKDAIIPSLDVTSSTLNLSHRSIDVKHANIDSARVSLTATQDVTLSSVVTSGTLPKSTSNAAISINTNEYVKITSSSLQQSSYNSVEIGLSNTAPRSVIIDGVDFGTLSNNAILIFATQPDTTITISNCHVTACSNFIRLSNRTNASNVTLNIINCIIDKVDQDPAWHGLIICEDYLKGTSATVQERNLFSPDKIKINIINTELEGVTLDQPSDLSTICGTKDMNQLLYIWNNYEASTSEDKAQADFVPYSVSRYPQLTIRQTSFEHI